MDIEDCDGTRLILAADCFPMAKGFDSPVFHYTVHLLGVSHDSQ